MRNIRDGRSLASLASMLVGCELKSPQKAWPQLNSWSALAHHRCSRFRLCRALLLAAAHAQVRPDERLQVSVQHAVHIAYFQFRAVVLNQPVGLQHVRSNLRSKLHAELG